jgi:hypothetical protein
MYQIHKVLIGIAIAAIAVAILFNTVDSTFFSKDESAAKIAPVAQPAQSLAGSSSTASPTTNAQDQLWEARRLLSTASTAVDKASGQIETWNHVMRAIKDGPAAEAIASNQELIESLASLNNEDRASPTEIRRAQQRIVELRNAIDARARETDPKPIPWQEMEEIRELSQTAGTARQDWDDAVARANAIERAGDRIINPVAETDLSGRIAEQQDKKTLEMFAEERQWNAEQASQQRALDAERVRAEEEAKQQSLREKELLIERSRSTEVANLLAPFFHPRDVQPKMSGASLRLRKTLETKPMSLSALQAIGALDAGIDGLKRLASAGGDRELSDPKWSVHSQPGNWSDGDKKMLQDAQRLLVELGPTLVEVGLLSP